MDETKTIPEILEMIANDFCDNYCKFQSPYNDDEWFALMESGKSPCNNCPIMLLI